MPVDGHAYIYITYFRNYKFLNNNDNIINISLNAYTFYRHLFIFFFLQITFLHSVTNWFIAGRTLFAEIRCRRRHSVFGGREWYNMRWRRRIENKYNWYPKWYYRYMDHKLVTYLVIIRLTMDWAAAAV